MQSQDDIRDAMRETVRQMTRPEEQPLTDGERARGLVFIEAVRRAHAELLARRGGVPFPSSAEILHELREERSQTLE